MVGGFAATVLWVLLLKERFFDLYEMIPGFAAGFACTIGISLLTEPDAGAMAELAEVRAEVGPVFGSRSAWKATSAPIALPRRTVRTGDRQ
jgi:Na+/proline symporter